MRVLAGDIGGTTTRLCVAECTDDICRLLRTQRFSSAAHAGLSAILREFLRHESVDTLDGACLAIAGPVRATSDGQVVQVTNLPWEIDSATLAQAFGLARIRLINDFEAIGYGIAALRDSDLVSLQDGNPVAHGPRAVIGAGTGLGQALLVWQDDRYTVIATEGGHADFGPADSLQIELARHLLARYGHASYELILSGPGLVRLYGFLREHGATRESAAVAEAMRSGDPAAAITHAALAQHDPLATQVVELFVRIYGAQAGNLALTAGATGGVYVAGGIAPKQISALRENFLHGFLNKGNMRAYVENIPLWVVMQADVGLLGAIEVARHASR